MSHRQITLGGGLVPSAASDAVVELAGLQRPGDLVKTEDDAGRHCFRADELERAWRVRNTDPSLDYKTRYPSNYRFGANCRQLGQRDERVSQIDPRKSLGLIGNAPAQKSLGVAEWRSPEHFR